MTSTIEYNLFDMLGWMTTRNVPLTQWGVDNIFEILYSSDIEEFLIMRPMVEGLTPENCLQDNYITAAYMMVNSPPFIVLAKEKIVPTSNV